MNEKPPATPFGIWIRENRKRLGLTQVQLSDAIDVGERTVVHWERSKHRPSQKMLAKLSILFDIPLSDAENAANRKSGESVYDPVITSIGRSAAMYNNRTCDSCAGLDRCKRATILGLPIMCEVVTERDIQAARVRGLEDELRASRRL